MALAVVIVLLVVGSLIFHFASPWYFTPLASNWHTIDRTVSITFIVCGIVFVAVNLFTAYCLVRYRHRQKHKAHYEPESKKLEGGLTAVTALGVAAMLTPGLFVWGDFVKVPEGAMQFEALGKQWNWSFRFPGKDGKFGHTEIRFLTPDNPFGMDPDDPNGRDDVLVASAEVHLPVGKPIHALLRSTDVLHDFTVPQFRTKMDLVPGMETYEWFTPIRTGSYEVLCEELCGLAHFAMRGRVVVEEEADFERWLAAQPTYGDLAAAPAGDATAGAGSFAVCSACHGTMGEGNQALNAPRIAGLEPWYVRRQIHNFQQGIRGADSNDPFGMQMAPMARTLASEQIISNVAAYLGKLPDNAPAPTVVGDTDRGQQIFETCAACHGQRGEGVWTTNAPRLAGMSDWYLVRQLQNFRDEARGAHPEDFYGAQMHMMSQTLKDEQAIKDVVAYIGTLR